MLRKSLMSPIINPAQLVIGYAHMPHNDLHFYRIKVRLNNFGSRSYNFKDN